MANKSLKIEGAWIAIIIAAGLAAMLLVAAYFLTSEVRALRQAEKNLANLTATRENLAELQLLVGNLGSNRETIDHYFVTTETLPAFIETVEKLASSTKVNFNLTGADSAVTNGSASVRLTFSASAPFPRLFQFLSLVDNLPQSLTITGANLATQKAGEWNGNFAVELLMVTQN